MIDALLRKEIGAPLSDFALIDLHDILEGIKAYNRIRAGKPAFTPEDWFNERLKNG